MVFEDDTGERTAVTAPPRTVREPAPPASGTSTAVLESGAAMPTNAPVARPAARPPAVRTVPHAAAQVDQAAGVTPALLERQTQAVVVVVVMVAAQLPKRVVPVLL